MEYTTQRKCRVCGQLFTISNARQQDCLKPIKKKCVVCGKEFDGRCSKNDTQTTCSKECRDKYASIQRQVSYSKTHIATCILCGKKFHPRTNTQVVCEDEHFRNCIVCGKQFKLDYKSSQGSADLRKTCSEECHNKLMSDTCIFRSSEARERIKKTMVEKYGVEHPAQSAEIREKMQATTEERYGVKFFIHHKDYKEKTEAASLEKYGTHWPSQSDEVKAKVQATSIERYGATNVMKNPTMAQKQSDAYKAKTGYSYPMQNPEVVEHTKQTNLEKYGAACYLTSEEGKGKVKQTLLDKYGVESPLHSDEIMKKLKETCLERYGSDCYLSSKEGKARSSARMKELYGKSRYSQLAEWKQATLSQCTNLDEWMKFVEDPEEYIRIHYANKPTYRKIASDTGVRPSTVNDCIIRYGLTNLIKYSQSYLEEEIADLLDSWSIDYVKHDRATIAPYEIDIVVPEFHLGIECNPTSTHNSSIPYRNLEDAEPTPVKYHQMKTDLCEEQGISLFHIFGYDWSHKSEIIKSMLRSRLNKSNTTIYARKCNVVEVAGSDAIKFLSANHRQGAMNSPIRLGLEYEGELVSLMTFGKMRGTVGTGKEDLSDCYELVRFCSIINTSVVGGASRLFKRFIENYKPHRIRSFSDRAHTSGKLYPSLGFHEVRRSDPGYVWVNLKDDVAYHRANAQKQNIRKFLKDDSIDLSKTEREIMIEHGFVQVFDSGTITWEWINK